MSETADYHKQLKDLDGERVLTLHDGSEIAVTVDPLGEGGKLLTAMVLGETDRAKFANELIGTAMIAEKEEDDLIDLPEEVMNALIDTKEQE